MSYYRRQVRVPRLRILRALLSRRGLVLTLLIKSDGDFIAAVDTNPPLPPRELRWREPGEVWHE